jgi:hypothetical protein
MKRKYYTIRDKSFEEKGVQNYQELWAKVKSEGYSALEIGVETVFTKAEDNSFDVTFSTASEDRHGDIVVQDWDLKAFKKNPVFLDSHNYGSIRHILGKIKGISIKDNKLGGKVIFNIKNPDGELAFNMAQDGFLNTTSVGFIPKEFGQKGEIMKSELLEVSAVSVPANSEALFERGYEGEEEDDTVDNIEEEDTVTEETIEEVIEETPEPAIEEEVAKVIGKPKKSLIQLLANESGKREQLLKNISLGLKGTKPMNTEERARKIWKELRLVISKDNA